MTISKIGISTYQPTSKSLHLYKQTTTKTTNYVEEKTQLGRKIDNYLCPKTIQKMLLRFFNETEISKEKITEALGITLTEFRNLFSSNPSMALIRKINLPLIRLYCKTKFLDSLQ